MNELVTQPKQELQTHSFEFYLDIQKFEHISRIALVFSKSDLVPQHFKGKPENCFIALQMALRLNIDPMLALQNIYIVYGNPGISSQLAISLANRSGVFAENIWFEESGTGNNLSVTAKAVLAKNKREISQTVSLAQAVQAGWTKTKDGGTKPFWAAMPGQMLRYRSAAYLIRSHAPDVILGMHTQEEWEDLGDNVEAPKKTATVLPLQQILENGSKPAAPKTEDLKLEEIKVEEKPTPEANGKSRPKSTKAAPKTEPETKILPNDSEPFEKGTAPGYSTLPASLQKSVLDDTPTEGELF